MIFGMGLRQIFRPLITNNGAASGGFDARRCHLREHG
jgi:hypothetical protein